MLNLILVLSCNMPLLLILHIFAELCGIEAIDSFFFLRYCVPTTEKVVIMKALEDGRDGRKST